MASKTIWWHATKKNWIWRQIFGKTELDTEYDDGDDSNDDNDDDNDDDVWEARKVGKEGEGRLKDAGAALNKI